MRASGASFRLGELAVRFGCELAGDPDLRISAVASLGGGADALGFLVNPAYLDELARTRLGAVILERRHAARCQVPALIHANPHAVFARVASLLHPPAPANAGVHPSAVVHPSARIAPDAEVGPLSVIEAGAVVGARCVVGPQGFVGRVPSWVMTRACCSA